MDLTLPIDQFLNSDFGEDVTATDVSETSSSSIRCLFYEGYAESGSDVNVEGTNPYCKCKTSDVSTLIQDDTILRGSTTYKIKEVQPGDDGWTVLILYKANT